MPNCSDCVSWAGHETGGTGLCRARAPLPGNTPTGDYGAIWPKTKATDYCGEFSTKGGKPYPVSVEGPEAVDPATAQHQQGQAKVAEPVSQPAQRIARSTNKAKRRSTR